MRPTTQIIAQSSAARMTTKSDSTATASGGSAGSGRVGVEDELTTERILGSRAMGDLLYFWRRRRRERIKELKRLESTELLRFFSSIKMSRLLYTCYLPTISKWCPNNVKIRGIQKLDRIGLKYKIFSGFTHITVWFSPNFSRLKWSGSVFSLAKFYF